MKVAAYCRVSTEYEDQTNSFETQKRFFKEHIERNPDWELYEIYADEGLSGTSTENRPGFNRMIEDAKAGKFDLILTKEVSRFARNTVDTLQYARELTQIADAQKYLEQLMAVDSEDAGIMTKLKKEVMDKLERMVSFEEAPDSFLASMVDHVKCYPDRTLEVALNILPTRWKYMLSRYSYSDKKEEQGPVSEPEPALLNNNVHRIASGPSRPSCQVSINIHSAFPL